MIIYILDLFSLFHAWATLVSLKVGDSCCVTFSDLYARWTAHFRNCGGADPVECDTSRDLHFANKSAVIAFKTHWSWTARAGIERIQTHLQTVWAHIHVSERFALTWAQPRSPGGHQETEQSAHLGIEAQVRIRFWSVYSTSSSKQKSHVCPSFKKKQLLMIATFGLTLACMRAPPVVSVLFTTIQIA